MSFFFFLKEANTWESNNTLERIVPLGQLGLMQNKTNIYKKNKYLSSHLPHQVTTWLFD